jgi:excisionase family DNA binding protein
LPDPAVEVETVSVQVPSLEQFEALAARVAALEARPVATEQSLSASPFMTIREAADYLRCSRQRVDDLLSQRRLGRLKDGSRTLIRRSDLDAYLANGGEQGRNK